MWANSSQCMQQLDLEIMLLFQFPYLLGGFLVHILTLSLKRDNVLQYYVSSVFFSFLYMGSIIFFMVCAYDPQVKLMILITLPCHLQVLIPMMSSQLEYAANAKDIIMIKTCLFSVCTSLMVSFPVPMSIRFI